MSTSRRNTFVGALVLVLITALSTYAVTTQFYQFQLARRLAAYEGLAPSPAFGRLLDVISLVREHYVDPTEVEQLLDGATTGVVEALGDPYSVYFNAEAFRDFEISLKGEYEGIGVVVTERDEYVTVQTPFPGSPGALAVPENNPDIKSPGLQPGDRITEVDGVDVVGVPVDKAAALIRGPVGTEVLIQVLRTLEDGSEVELRFRIERAQIEIPTIQQANMLTPAIGYIWLTQFTPDTPQHLRGALEQLRAAGMKALILDLRNNPGGELGASVQVAAEFVPEGPVVHVVRRDHEPQTFSSDSPSLGLPLVVLINQGSASASEIVAGAIQDYATGILVGEQTFGKGSVQTVYTLEGSEDGAAGIKLTTAKYLTPKERSIHGVGLTPDVEVVAVPDRQGDPSADEQLRRAIAVLEEQLADNADD